jgi:hypothetical protein
MFKPFYIALPIAATLSCTLMAASEAQNIQGWESAQQNSINQAQATNALTPGEASRLDSKESAIQAQQQQYMNQNGGHLTGGEKAQIGNEMRNVNQRMQTDEFNNAQNASGQHGHHRRWQANHGFGQQQMPQNMNGGFVPPGGQGYPPNANGYYQNSNGYMPGNNGNSQQQSSGGGMMNMLKGLMGGQNGGGRF